LPTDDQTAYYHPIENRVYTSVSMIARCTSEACVDSHLFHELGHACSTAHANVPLTNQVFRRFDYSRAFRHFATPEVAECIDLMLNAGEAIHQFWEYSRAAWNEEVLANLVFIAERRGPAHWAWWCHSRSDFSHSNVQVLFNCFLEIPAVRANICGSEATNLRGSP
jgi:hypothetical protein